MRLSRFLSRGILALALCTILGQSSARAEPSSPDPEADELKSFMDEKPDHGPWSTFNRLRAEPLAGWAATPASGANPMPQFEQMQFELLTSGKRDDGSSPWSFGWRAWLEAATQSSGRPLALRGDVSELWVGWTQPQSRTRSLFVIGRIHPWTLADHPDAERPWGYLAQNELRSTTLGLGTGHDPDFSMAAQPELVGWTGLHYWSNASPRAHDFQWGVSVTPILEREPLGSNSGIFTPQVPTMYQWQGQAVPLTVTNAGALQNRIVAWGPQAQIMARIQTVEAVPIWSGWFSAGRTADGAPTWVGTPAIAPINGDLQATSTLNATYPMHWNASFTQMFRPTRGSRVFTTARVVDDGTFGFEAGFGGSTWTLSLMQEWNNAAQPPIAIGAAPYANFLATASWRQPFGDRFATLIEARSHLTQGDLWGRIGGRVKIIKGLSVDAGFDLFTGSDNSYFGTWRGNDDVFLGLNWDLRS